MARPWNVGKVVNDLMLLDDPADLAVNTRSVGSLSLQHDQLVSKVLQLPQMVVDRGQFLAYQVAQMTAGPSPCTTESDHLTDFVQC